MYVSKIAPEARTWALVEAFINPVAEAPAPQPRPLWIVQPTCRGEHARMLAIAAARRLRAVERAGLARGEDAGYWKAVAPFAIRKAAGLRGEVGFGRLPG
ncbi:MAG: hypothetical protein BGN86_05285 [Caulobacterales bacterium 68-7]|nr:MAG: hypothetical protein BGN86_05285 [Caulobacterales bacterium 68-7]